MEHTTTILHLTEARLRARRHRRLSRREGMTLIEIMVVVIIMAMIAAAVGVAVFPMFGKAKIKQAKTDTKTLQSAVELFLVNGGEGCPTVDDMLQSGELKKGTNTEDPWGTAFQINCEGDDVTVTSAGPDKQFGTEDDI
ncbi:MAG: type II secretion system protein GspG [Myxococcales bacterium]|nr:type II secretion system protein GspG [Myxococcales bacterium]